MKKSGLLIGLVFITAGAVFSQATNYTYTYDFWDEANASPDAYRVSAYLLGAGLGIQDFRDPQGLYVRDNRIYVCDSGNNRIVRIEVDNNGTHTVTAVVNSVMINGVKSNFAYPMDIFETGQGVLYIADTNNNRILILDHNWNYIASIVKPKDETIDETTEFLPVKLVVDFANRLFVQALNINKGLLEFDTENNFVGYMGANKVHFNPIDYVWKMVFSTAEQRKQMSLFIPSEYNNLCIDNEGFIYVTNNSQKIAPVRRLNARGQDILVR
ncbi:MAG: hypothetical protein FWF29_12060, partial [Treponema sp.]|nr:hypothetical protein [Treponema sp.]